MPRRQWKKYINGQKYSECQLVTAINALYYLTGKTIKPDSDEYEELVDVCAARNGAAIFIKKIHKKFGIKIIKEIRHRSDLEPGGNKKMPLPVEWRVWHKRTGFHSTLIIDHCPRVRVVRVANFRHETSNDGWIFIEDLYKFEDRLKQNGPPYRLFGLTK